MLSDLFTKTQLDNSKYCQINRRPFEYIVAGTTPSETIPNTIVGGTVGGAIGIVVVITVAFVYFRMQKYRLMRPGFESSEN